MFGQILLMALCDKDRTKQAFGSFGDTKRIIKDVIFLYILV